MTVPPFLRSDKLFAIVASLVPVCLFLNAQISNTSVIIFTVFCFINLDRGIVDRLKKYHILLLAPAILVLLYFAWALMANDPADGLNRTFRKLPLLILPLAFLALRENDYRKKFTVILTAFTAACLAATLVCVVVAIKNVMIHGAHAIEGLERPYYYWSYTLLVEPMAIDPIYFSMYCNLALLIVLTRDSLRWWAKALLSAWLITFVIVTAAKVGTLCMVMLICIWIAFKIKKGVWTWVTTVVVFVTIVTVLSKITFIRERFGVSTEYDITAPFPHQWNSVSMRLAIWDTTIKTAMESPWIGYGSGEGQKALEAMYKERGFVRALAEEYNPHNEYFSALLDLGILGFVCMAVMVVYPGIMALRMRNVLFCGFCVLMIMSFGVESLLLRQKGITFFAFFLPLFAWYYFGGKISQSKSEGDIANQ
ncbi:MAG TPA: O-antigen ligase family protein [Cyclobacteriaceae bacterium]|nr:O-antigen ligase family protein [Cyclobacteriaceae bacterium]